MDTGPGVSRMCFFSGNGCKNIWPGKIRGKLTFLPTTAQGQGSPQKKKSSGRYLKNLNLARASSIIKYLLLHAHARAIKISKFFHLCCLPDCLCAVTILLFCLVDLMVCELCI